MRSDAFVRGVRGPIGSGKSVACCMELMRRAKEMAPCYDGVRRSRWVIVRNTLPQLETTTLKTWCDWFPEHTFGRITKRPPYTQNVVMDIGNGDRIEAEFLFLALDKPEDVKKVLSLECTGAWINEAREVPKEILDALTGRVGRYPSRKDMPQSWQGKWPSYSGIIMDTNSPNDDHWWYHLAEEETPQGYEFFCQPSGTSRQAENRENLPDNYYEKMTAGKSQEWIQVFIFGGYGVIEDGMPVYGKNYVDDLHTAPMPLVARNEVPLMIGLDFGLTPCAIIGQQNWQRQWFILEEIITEDTSIEAFGQLLLAELNQKYGGFKCKIFGDPAGGYRNPNDGRTAFSVIASATNNKLIVRSAPTNKFLPRKDAVLRCLTQMAGGQPRLIIDKRCTMLRRGFNGGYKYKRIQVTGEAKYGFEPDKNKFSHPHDALQYLLCGGGEYREMMTGSEAKGNGQTRKMKPWSPK